MELSQYQIVLVNLEPTIGSEMNKTRPCVIISPNEMNEVLNTVIIAPLTSTMKNYPSRINCFVKDKNGQIALDQLRCVDKSRLKNQLSVLNKNEQNLVLEVLYKMFSK